MLKLNPGFIPALGTPHDAEGNLIEESYRAHIEDQISHGCAALLSMGSMGIQASLRNEVAYQTARVAVDQAAGRVPVFVGCMDCSIARAKERMNALEDVKLSAFVFTAPYYETSLIKDVYHYFDRICHLTAHNVILYDLPSVVQFRLPYEMLVELAKNNPNFVGIKTNCNETIRKIKKFGDLPEDFIVCYSGLDTFDVCYGYGFTNYLDGMISCAPNNIQKMDEAFKKGDMETATRCLNNVVWLRDLFCEYDLMPAFTHAMNLLGFEGDFHFDYELPESEECRETVRQALIKIGEL